MTVMSVATGLLIGAGILAAIALAGLLVATFIRCGLNPDPLTRARDDDDQAHWASEWGRERRAEQQRSREARRAIRQEQQAREALYGRRGGVGMVVPSSRRKGDQ